MNESQGYLLRQFDMAAALLAYHLDGLTTEECLWRPAAVGLHVHRAAGDAWRADWPDHEGYTLGPSSIAWTTWHIGFWWSMSLDHAFGNASLAKEDVLWPGDADSTRKWLATLQQEWRGALAQLTDDDLRSPARSKWPFKDQPFGDIVAWLNIELMKNAAEIGYARFLYAVRAHP